MLGIKVQIKSLFKIQLNLTEKCNVIYFQFWHFKFIFLKFNYILIWK